MRKTIYFTVIYSIFVILGGFMSFWHGENLESLFFEILGGGLLLGSCYFLMNKKRYIYFVNIFISLILAVFFGYAFSKGVGFYPGLMMLITVFFIGSYLIDVFNIYKY
jgi:uncharacterized membrane protein (UPF0136 family)